MNKSGLILVGAAVAILGYALLYSGLTKLNPGLCSGVPGCDSTAGMGTITALVPSTSKQKAA